MDWTRLGRVVITGHRDHTSAVCSDLQVDAVPLAGPAAVAHFLWGDDDPGNGAHPRDVTAQSPLPLPGGYRVSYLRLAPGSQTDYHTFIRDTFGNNADQQHPGFHRTPTVDISVVVQGTLRLELDDGTVDLEAGAVVVQNGTNHRWSNVGDDEVVLATVMLGTPASAPPVSAQG